ncbi:MAG: arginine decarboxylase [Saprospiraceae bacterium]|jgi:arginine decarboxylase|nr:arginine decarboxylase [Saprospiraceae bacterium]MBK6480627.1 arginine decarboxylase [Saprospiraceae bacterium]MBK6817013.1 arginine decarboxylase [Saprospiraceae bacterium]MBK7371543.1 arginine decarboxylase [Saprospiraceae bacterium]MBK7435960.1 arginine decarboxylase [Saprospiraceae bacterium]
MKNRYFDLIEQTFYFPQEGFDIENGYLDFNGIPLIHLIRKYGTPLKLTYLPRIGAQIKRARNLFNRSMKNVGYNGQYYYCYCTKACHFRFILEEVLQNGAHLETSSSFDIDLIRKLHLQNQVDKNEIILCNGYKAGDYGKKISKLINEGFKNVIPILDNKEELAIYEELVENGCKIGMRVATEEEPNFQFYTSRLGIRNSEVIQFYKDRLANNPKFKLEVLHFFVDTGIKDTIYYWGEFKKVLKTYCELKKICPDLRAIDIGGGLPIRNSLGFEYDYSYMINEIVKQIKIACQDEGIPEPDIFSEFGKYTVGESGATIFSVIGQKQQNDSELWYMIDNSLMNTIPDSWGMAERFILLPINKWYNDFTRVNIGGITCDNSDFYNSEVHENQVYLPAFSMKDPEPLYLGFFHTGAYQDALSGYGGIKHCLIPSPKHILVDRDEQGNLVDRIYLDEQEAEGMLKILGY